MNLLQLSLLVLELGESPYCSTIAIAAVVVYLVVKAPQRSVAQAQCQGSIQVM
jgi:hypothetical protein